MADFSKQWCEINDPDMPSDFDILEIAAELEPGYFKHMICEGFGFTIISLISVWICRFSWFENYGSQADFLKKFLDIENLFKIDIYAQESYQTIEIMRLRTRFNWGLTANIYPPDYELRIAILRKKIETQALVKEIPNDVIVPKLRLDDKRCCE